MNKIICHNQIDHDKADCENCHQSVCVEGNGGSLGQTHQKQNKSHNNNRKECVVNKEKNQLLLVENLYGPICRVTGCGERRFGKVESHIDLAVKGVILASKFWPLSDWYDDHIM